VTIAGTNLGYNISQVRAVTVAGVPCNVTEDEYVISFMLVTRISL